MNNLSFKTLREANTARLPQFKNKHGEPAHSQPDGSDWNLAEWLECVTGELGELCNLHKKYRRGDISKEEWERESPKEFADIACYLDIAAFQAKIDLGQAVQDKFNEVSDRVESNIKINGAANRVSYGFIEEQTQKLEEKLGVVKPFVNALQDLLNSYSMENGSNTPDFILAEYMIQCLLAFEICSIRREEWYGVSHRPGKI